MGPEIISSGLKNGCEEEKWGGEVVVVSLG